MESIEKSVEVNTSPHALFVYLDDPANLPSLWPAMLEVREIERTHDGAHNFHWSYLMAGTHFEGIAESIHYTCNQCITLKTRGGIESTLSWRLEPIEGATRVIFTMEYEIPAPLLRKHTRQEILARHEQDAEAMLANLQKHFSAEPTPE